MNLQNQTPSTAPANLLTIVDRVDIAASAERVLAALTTAAGIRSWWTADCEVSATEHTYRFRMTGPGASSTFRVERQDARGISLVCVASDGMGWLGTRLAFAIEPAGDKTRVMLTHTGFASTEVHEKCTGGWRYFLGSLRAQLETGTGTPHIPGAPACNA